MYNSKKQIKDSDGIFNLSAYDCIEKYKGVCFKHAYNCKSTLSFLSACSYLDVEDYYNESLQTLVECWQNYDIRKSTVKFSNYLLISLENLRKSIIASANTQKRLSKNPISIDAELDNSDSNSNMGSIIEKLGATESVEDTYLEDEQTMEYITLLKDTFTKEELLIILSNIKKESINNNPNVAYLSSFISSIINEQAMAKKDLCKILKCSAPTLRSRTKKLEEEFRQKTAYYFSTRNKLKF